MSIYIKISRHPLAFAVSPTRLVNYIVKQMNYLWRDASRAFILATIRASLVDTAMSRASLLPLAKEVQYKLAAYKEVVQGQKNIFRPGSTTLAGAWQPDGARSAYEGVKLGQKAYQYVRGTRSNPLWIFHFEYVVFQHLFWDKKTSAIDLGGLAFVKYLASNWRDYLSEAVVAGYLETGQFKRTLSFA